jgi:hypothetical protein
MRMRMFHVPIQINDEELIMGGKFSLRQMIIALIGVVISGGLGFAMPGPVAIRATLAIILLCFFAFLVFAKIHGMSADRFIWYYIKYYYSEKIYW